MAVSGISGTGASALASARQGIADNFDTFLQLLTTQLKNQNPLDPLDTNQFTAQLVQFTSVEQQLKTNDFLEAMLLSTQNTQATQAVGYIGKQVTASSTKAVLDEGRADWGFYLDDTAETVTVSIRDMAGNVVYTEIGELPAGEGQFTWDGVGNDGRTYPEGSYSITIDARDANNHYVPVRTEVGGIVTAVDLTGSEPVLIVGNSRIALSSVTSVRTPAAPEPEPETEPETQPTEDA